MPDIFSKPTNQDSHQPPQHQASHPAPQEHPQPIHQQEASHPQQQASHHPSHQPNQSSQHTTGPATGAGITASIHKIVTTMHPTRPLGLFSHYCTNPAGISFVNQERNEHIILFLRRHFITNIGWIFWTIIFLLLPPIINFLVTISGISAFSVPDNLLLVGTIFYYLLVLNIALINFILWFYHVGIVTQKRLMDLDVYNILNHHLAETQITEVVDVSYAQQGFFQSFFNYGNIPIQTEAIKANFEFELSPKPSTVSDIITDLRAEILGHK